VVDREARRAAAAASAGDPSLVDQVSGQIGTEATNKRPRVQAATGTPVLHALRRALAQTTEPALRANLTRTIEALAQEQP